MRLSFTLLVVLALSRGAAADPVLSRVLTAPTAWLPPAGTTIGTAGYGRFGDGGMFNLGVGLGGIAAVDIGAENDVRGCTDCAAMRGEAIWMGRAGFRLGVRQGAWGRGAPAFVFGVRTTFGARGHTFGKARAAEAHLVASWVVGPTRVHAGVAALDAGFHDDVTLGPTVRPLGGFEWTPREFPKSSLMVDIMWVPRLEPDKIELERVLGIGVRYQALSWGSIELGVRNREDDGLAGTTVLVRVNGVWGARDRTKKATGPR
jgi:hypothetical protein